MIPHTKSTRHLRISPEYLFQILILTNLLATCIHAFTSNATKDTFREELYIRPLPDGKLYTQFLFRTLYRSDIANLRWENRVEIFPLSISDLIETTDIEDLHFSLTRGNWDDQNWGYSTNQSPPGAQIRAKFQRQDVNLTKHWKKLVNALAGKFCSSLALENHDVLAFSKLAFGDLYANLPEENLCTGSLTPWRKLLPCYTNSGLGSLLNAVNLLKSSYISMRLDLEPLVINDEKRVRLDQYLTVVFNPLQLFDGKQSWSLSRLFGNPLRRACPVSEHSLVHVDVTDLRDINQLYPQGKYEIRQINMKLREKQLGNRKFALFDANTLLSNSSSLDIGVKQTQLFKKPPASSRATLPIKFSTHVAGLGAGDGAIIATIINNHHEPVKVTYMDVMPYFLRIYLHTLSIRSDTDSELEATDMNYIQAKDKSPTLIEFNLIVPANSRIRISYEFEKAFLRWTEFRADANKGVLIGSATLKLTFPLGIDHLTVATIALANNSTSFDMGTYDDGNVIRLYSRPLLIILPTPDFSMPYNVICLVCTVLVAAFGPLHSITTRRTAMKVSKASLLEFKKRV